MAYYSNMSRFPRRSLGFLPLAFLLHVGEEWFAGFPAWTAEWLGREVAAERFLLINGIAVTLAVLAVILALRLPRLLPAGLVVAGVLTLNGLLHVLATLAFGVYSPGVITGLFLYLPFGGRVLLWASRALSFGMFSAILAASVVVHGAVAFVAFV